MKSALHILVISTFSCFAASVLAADNDTNAALAKPYVTVNGSAQSNAKAEVLLREQLARGVKDSQELRDGVRDALVNQALMEQEAHKAGLDKEVLVQAQIELARQSILAQAWQQKALGELQIKDEDLKAEYDRQIARLGDKEYLIRHLLVADESTAKLLLEKVQSGAKIADLAKEYSRDPNTNEKGGLSDWTAQGNLLPPVSAALKTLQKGKVAGQAVKTDAGWHILQLEDSRPLKAPSLQDLKPQLTQIVARRFLDAQLKALREKAKVE